MQVTGQAPALQSDSSVLTTVITQKATQDLPLNGRNYVNLGATRTRRQRRPAKWTLQRRTP